MRIDAQLLQAETGKSDCQRGRLRELAERVVKTIDRTDDLLAEFFALGRPEENEREAFNVNAAVTDCVELLKTRFEKAGFHLASDLAHEPLRVQGFPAQFKRAILNILTNAEQFSPAGGRVTIQTRLEKKLVVIRITDEGPGIPTPEREKIFDLFYSNRPSGMGIGLALARTAIENCGGKIECGTPPEGKGTVFTIRIPIRT
jgi:signal transduction histidine kinase